MIGYFTKVLSMHSLEIGSAGIFQKGVWTNRFMQDELVEKLTSFGFTVNQAKVYLSIVQSSKTHVGKISKDTQLHRQDIYKLLPKLESMGLITKTIDKPFRIEALPVQKALESLILKEKAQINERIANLERNLKEISEAMLPQPETKEEARFTLLTTGEAMRNRSNQSFKKKRKNFNVVSTTENLRSSAGNFYREFFQQVAENGAKIRLIIVGNEESEEMKQMAEKIGPKKGYFKVKTVERCACKNYQVVDNREVWIATQQKTQAGYPNILWTNDQNIVEAYSENFAETWNSPRAILIYQNKEPQKMFSTNLVSNPISM
jgi:DNA-binding MarR family transcriptional regulator